MRICAPYRDEPNGIVLPGPGRSASDAVWARVRRPVEVRTAISSVTGRDNSEQARQNKCQHNKHNHSLQ
jgi:hypothetical protein